MTTAELQQWLRDGGGPLALDTNVVYGDVRLFELCDRLNTLKQRRVASHTTLFIGAVVYSEKLHDLRQKHAQRYDPDVILQGMRRKGLVVRDFTHLHADHLARLLGERYPSATDWYAFKRTLYLKRLGLPQDMWEQAPATGQNCGATVDWLIAAQADCEGWLLVTEDDGLEFRGIKRIRLARLEDALQGLIDETP